jgi:hypothetical protein
MKLKTLTLGLLTILGLCSALLAQRTLNPQTNTISMLTSNGLPGHTLTISATLPPATTGESYNATFTASGGTAPYHFMVSSGQLPTGLVLGKTGVISGAPTEAGTFTFTVSAADLHSHSGSQSFGITVSKAPSVVVTVSPTTATLTSAATQQFSALVSNTSNVAVTWSASLGTISSAGLYTAPTVSANTTTTVTATSVADPTKSSTASLTITPSPVSITTSSLSNATAGTGYSNTLIATGGTTPYTWAITSGSLPTGIILQSAGLLSGTTSQNGQFNITVQVSDSSSPKQTSSKSFTLTVIAAVSVTVNPSTITLVSGASTQFTATVANTSNLNVTWSASAGTISSTGFYQAPTVSGNTTATITATSAADPTKSATAFLTITPPPLNITTTSVSGATAGTAYSNPLTATGGTAPYAWTLTSGTLPTGIALQSAGSLSGTTSQAGQFNFTVKASDSSSPQLTASQSLTLTVAPPPLSITTTSVSSATAATAYSNPLTATGGTTPYTWTLTSGTLPTGITLQSTGSLSGTATQAGQFTFTVKASDSSSPQLTASQSFTLTVAPPPLSITTTSVSGATAATAYSNLLTATGGTAPYSWTLTSGTLPTGIALQSSGSLSGTTTQAGQFSFTVKASDSSSPQLTASRSLTLTVNGPLLPAAFFGFSESDTNGTNWPTVTYQMQRFWDSQGLQWPSLNTASGVFDFTSLDADLALALTNGATENMYTLSRTPPWATSNPNDTSCNYTTGIGGGNGECDPPSDLNSDGSGSNAIWKAWITAIASHVNDPTYLQTHAHIKYWEIWNEPDTKVFFAGSIAQLARLTEDANCIITGRGVIHENGNGTATPCTATPIDPTAQIVMASAHAKTVALVYGQNELYCNNTSGIPSYELPCPNPPNAIATAVDIVNFHMKPGNESGDTCPAPTPCTPESATEMYLSNIHGILQPAELAKPLWNGEAQYSSFGFTNAYADVDMAASFMPRFYLLNWSLGVDGIAWYMSSSSVAEPAEAETSYQQTYNWLVSASLVTPCAANGSVWSCEILNSGTLYLIMWDASQSCANGSCTTATQTVASQWTEYQDMTTASTAIPISGGVVPVGIKPVILH